MANLSISQLRAIRKAAIYGRRLQEDLPVIAEDYEELSKPQIVKKHNLEERYNINNDIATNAVRLAIRGHEGRSNVKPYQGLIKDKNKLEELASKHQAMSSKSISTEQRIKNGKKAHKLGLGVHAFTSEQRKQVGKKGGMKARDNNLGFHALSPEQKKENQKKAMIASGNKEYLPNEKERILELADHPDYQNGTRGPSYRKIKEHINQEFHKGEDIRTRSSINYVLFRG